VLVSQVGRIIRYSKGTVQDAVGVILEVSVENRDPSPGCRILWLYNPPDDAKEAWVLSKHLEIIL